MLPILESHIDKLPFELRQKIQNINKKNFKNKVNSLNVIFHPPNFKQRFKRNQLQSIKE